MTQRRFAAATRYPNVSSPDFVIRSDNEMFDEGHGFWSNDEGWVGILQATHFSEAEMLAFTLPHSPGQDAKWVPWKDAGNNHFHDGIEGVFLQEFARSCDKLRKEGAIGQAYVVFRGAHVLQMTGVAIPLLDINYLDVYEMVIFDGVNECGDAWKHVYFPQEQRHYFVEQEAVANV